MGCGICGLVPLEKRGGGGKGREGKRHGRGKTRHTKHRGGGEVGLGRKHAGKEKEKAVATMPATP